MAHTDVVEKEHHEVHDTEASWEGGSEPFKASYGKLMM